VGRPLKDISKNDVQKLASFGCNNTEIAEFCNVSEKTIRIRFSEILTKERIGLKGKLRKAQIDFALKGNATLLIWLGKNMLGQKEPENTQNGLTETEIQSLRKIANAEIENNI
jgi:hypothetical protein